MYIRMRKKFRERKISIDLLFICKSFFPLSALFCAGVTKHRVYRPYSTINKGFIAIERMSRPILLCKVRGSD